MRWMVSSLAVVAVLGGSAVAFAGPPAPPSPEAVRAVWEFFEHGKGQGVVLGEVQLCTEITKTADNKNQCAHELPTSGIKPGTQVYVLQSYLVPKDEEVGDLTVQVKEGDTIRETKDVGLMKGSNWRVRLWSGVRLGKSGAWSISILKGTTVLKRFALKVE